MMHRGCICLFFVGCFYVLAKLTCSGFLRTLFAWDAFAHAQTQRYIGLLGRGSASSALRCQKGCLQASLRHPFRHSERYFVPLPLPKRRKPSTGVFECPCKEVRSKSLALAVGDGTAQIRIVDNVNLLVENCKLVKIYNNKLYFMQ